MINPLDFKGRQTNQLLGLLQQTGDGFAGHPKIGASRRVFWCISGWKRPAHDTSVWGTR